MEAACNDRATGQIAGLLQSDVVLALRGFDGQYVHLPRRVAQLHDVSLAEIRPVVVQVPQDESLAARSQAQLETGRIHDDAVPYCEGPDRPGISAGDHLQRTRFHTRSYETVSLFDDLEDLALAETRHYNDEI